MDAVNTADALARLAAFGLPGVPDEPIELEDPQGLLDAATGRRALPWVAGAVAAGQVAGATDDWRAELRRRHLGAVQTTMAAHAAAIDVAERLRTAGIGDVRILKGCATAHLDYAQPVDRFSSDVDLLVRPDDRPAFIARFPDTVVPAPRREGWQNHYGKSTTVKTETRVEVDVHTMLGQGYFGHGRSRRMSCSRPRSNSRSAASSMLALDGPNRLIHAANHVARLRITRALHSIRDVLQLVLVSEVDWEEAIDPGRAVEGRCPVRPGSDRSLGDVPGADPPAGGLGATGGSSRSAAARARRRRTAGREVTSSPRRSPFRSHRWPGYVLPDAVPVEGVPGGERQGLEHPDEAAARRDQRRGGRDRGVTVG